MIKKYNDEAAYEAAGLPTDESRIAQIKSTNDIKIDGINVLVDVPELGDAVYHDGTKAIFFKGGNLFNASKLPDNIKNNKIGVVVDIIDDYAVIINKDSSSLKYCDVVQYLLTAPTLDGESHTLSISLRLSTDYTAWTTISFTYSATSLSEVVTVLNEAIDAKKTEAGFTNIVWAYVANDDNEKVDGDEDATKIIVLIDVWSNENLRYVQGGALIVWGDMPANSNGGWRINGKTAGAHSMSVSKSAEYYSTSGRVPTDIVQLNEDDNIITLEAFNGEFGKILRDTYGTYEKYITAEYSIMYPQKLGLFGLPDGKTLTQKYGNMTAQTKSGGVKYKFPAMHYALNIGYNNVEGLEVGDWYLPGVNEGVVFMEDNRRDIINSTANKMGIAQLNNSSPRWFALSGSSYYAWFFSGTSGYLYTYYVRYARVALAVALLKIKH